eukprot:3375401-Pyramimonas_sp.AAC.1
MRGQELSPGILGEGAAAPSLRRSRRYFCARTIGELGHQARPPSVGTALRALGRTAGTRNLWHRRTS